MVAQAEACEQSRRLPPALLRNAVHEDLTGDLEMPLVERGVLDGVKQALPERQCSTEAAGAAVFGGRLLVLA